MGQGKTARDRRVELERTPDGLQGTLHARGAEEAQEEQAKGSKSPTCSSSASHRQNVPPASEVRGDQESEMSWRQEKKV